MDPFGADEGRRRLTCSLKPLISYENNYENDGKNDECKRSGTCFLEFSFCVRFKSSQLRRDDGFSSLQKGAGGKTLVFKWNSDGDMRGVE